MNDVDKLRCRKRASQVADDIHSLFVHLEFDVHEALEAARALVDILEPWAQEQRRDEIHYGLFDENELLTMPASDRAAIVLWYRAEDREEELRTMTGAQREAIQSWLSYDGEGS